MRFCGWRVRALPPSCRPTGSHGMLSSLRRQTRHPHALCVSQCCITLTPRRDAPRQTAELALPSHPVRLLWRVSGPLPPYFWHPRLKGGAVGSCSRDDNGEIYYFNFKTGESEWDHPCDAIFHDKCVARCPPVFRPSKTTVPPNRV